MAFIKKSFIKTSQFMNEKMGKDEGTKLDEQYHELARCVDATQLAVTQFLSKSKEMLHPNPATRAKLSLSASMYKIRGSQAASARKYQHPENNLAESTTKGGHELNGEEGNGTAFGFALVDFGSSMKELADAKDELDFQVGTNVLEPLQQLLDKDIKEIEHHRKKVKGRRLEMDGKVRRQAGGSKITDDEVELAQDKFQESFRLATQGMANLLNSDVEQISQLAAFTDALLEYHKRATDTLETLQSTLASHIDESQRRPSIDIPDVAVSMERKPSRKVSSYDPSPNNDDDDTDAYQAPILHSSPPPSSTSRASSSKTPCAKALYDFEAENEGELEFSEGDMITLTTIVDDNWMEGELNGATGFFPNNYVEVVVPL